MDKLFVNFNGNLYEKGKQYAQNLCIFCISSVKVVVCMMSDLNISQNFTKGSYVVGFVPQVFLPCNA